MVKKETKHSHFIPSLFPAVTEYENAFVKSWNENAVNAVAEDFDNDYEDGGDKYDEINSEISDIVGEYFLKEIKEGRISL